MPPTRRKGFFGQTPVRPEDELARQQDVEALIAPRPASFQHLPLERLRPNPFQARHKFEDLKELAAAIQAQGFTSRLRVRPDPVDEGYFQLVYGERRLRAAQLAGLAEVPCEISEHSNEEMIEVGLAENIQRRDLSPLEEARAFSTFTREQGYSVRNLAEKIGKDKSYVQDRLELLRVPVDVQAMVNQRSDTVRAAREIAKLATPAQRQPLIEGILQGKLNVHDIRSMIAEQAEPGSGSVAVNGTDAEAEAGDGTSSGDRPAAESSGSASPQEEQPFPAAGRSVKPRRPEPTVERQLERDGRLVLSALARCHETAASLNLPQKELLRTYLSKIISEISGLQDKLKA